MTLFAIFFNVFSWYRGLEPEVFRDGQLTLDARFGLANTFILLTSSWFVVLALRAVREHRRYTALRHLAGALLCGLGFVALKIVEYGAKIGAGITLNTNDFYMLYFMFTGIHLLHLILGLGVLVFLMSLSRRTEWSDSHIRFFEGGAVFWHMVDLLWIILFPLIYLVRG